MFSAVTTLVVSLQVLLTKKHLFYLATEMNKIIINKFSFIKVNKKN